MVSVPADHVQEVIAVKGFESPSRLARKPKHPCPRIKHRNSSLDELAHVAAHDDQLLDQSEAAMSTSGSL
ncbi:MAG: hypothetical protein ACREJ5_18890 [Geminicoccaceae bacterium]